MRPKYLLESWTPFDPPSNAGPTVPLTSSENLETSLYLEKTQRKFILDLL